METPKSDPEVLRQKLEANSSQTRGRCLREYDQLLGISVYNIALDHLKEGPFMWLDMGCGQFQAGSDLMEWLGSYYGEKPHPGIQATGVDLVTKTPGKTTIGNGAVIERADFITYPIPPDTNLVTCVFGLVQINKYGNDLAAKAVQNWYNQLPEGGRLVFNIDELGGNPFWDQFLFRLKMLLGSSVDRSYRLDVSKQYRAGHSFRQQGSRVINITKKESDSRKWLLPELNIVGLLNKS